jgi:hypothetical protein
MIYFSYGMIYFFYHDEQPDKNVEGTRLYLQFDDRPSQSGFAEGPSASARLGRNLAHSGGDDHSAFTTRQIL